MEQFQGPLDLLLQLTEEKKLDITEISLAKVTNQYLNFLKKSENIPLENLADFLVVASRLILIKSRMLLPALELTEEEEEDIKALKRQLEEYKKFRNLAKEIEKIALTKNIAYSREKYQGFKSIFYPPKNFKLEDLKAAFKRVMEEIALLEEKLPEKSLKLKLSLEEKIKKIQQELSNRIQTTFQELAKSETKTETIVSFLALLELIKQKIITAKQEQLY
ncbi:MAG: segregation and condensation protein A, partial [Methanosarcinales archaeon]